MNEYSYQFSREGVMTLKRLKEVIKEAFTISEATDEYEEALHQLLAMIEKEEEYRRKVNEMMGGNKYE